MFPKCCIWLKIEQKDLQYGVWYAEIWSTIYTAYNIKNCNP